MPIRHDRAKPKKWEKTPAGFLRAMASLTKVGVFGYDLPDGTTRQELRTEEEVFHPDSLASFAMLPVVLEHPPEMLITSKNVDKYQKGSAGENLTRDGEKMVGNVMVTHQDAIEEVESGKRAQISMGYTCDLRPEAGVWKGKPYTHVQVNIRGNHIALTKEGRMGNDIGIRLDSADAIATDLIDEASTTPAGTGGIPRSEAMEKVLINGVWVEIPSQAAQLLKVERELAAKNDSLVADRVKAADAAVKEAQARADKAEGAAAAAEKARNDAADPKRLDSLVAERIALLETARSVLGAEVKLDGKDMKAIKLEVLKKFDPDASFDGKNDAFIDGAFEVVVKGATKTDSSGGASGAMRRAAGNAGSEPSGAEKAYLEMQKRQSEKFSKPIGYSVK